MENKILVVLFIISSFLFAQEGFEEVSLKFEPKVESIDFDFATDPMWLNTFDVFIGTGITEGSGKNNIFWFGQFDFRPFVWEKPENIFRLGLHLGFDTSRGSSSVYEWGILAGETGVSYSYQRPTWQVSGHFSYRFLFQSGDSLISTYESKGQSNHQVKTQVTIEKFFEGNWFNLVQFIGVACFDFSKEKDSYFDNKKISVKNDPASNQGLYGGEFTLHIWNDRETWIVPQSTVGAYYNEWDRHVDVKVGVGLRLFDFVYLNGGYQFGVKTNNNSDPSNGYYVSLGIDVRNLISNIEMRKVN